jgi:hypothetical protein
VSTLRLPLKGLYFRQIKWGTKEFEYRLTTDYWKKRLVGREYGSIELTLGYPASTDLARHLHRPYLGYEVQTIRHPHFGVEPVEVFAIRVNVPYQEPPRNSIRVAREGD